ncbi:hypothetical protein [Niallia oryzisoli]|uniref:hypothetical protein n=1 Tax=Niallia oryzisoli TaxID=1737571 RepID=UPI0037361946
MSRKLFLSVLTVFLIFISVGCSKPEVQEETYAEFWNQLDRNQKQWLVSTELEKLKASGYSIIVEEYYFIDRLDRYYTDDPPGDLPVKEALKKIGLSSGVIQL